MATTTDNNRRGTCPICFRNFKAVKGPVSRHGYKVINGGHGGWQTGACAGGSFPRFEDSTEGTEYALKQVRMHLESEMDERDRLATNPPIPWSPSVGRRQNREDYPASRTLLDGQEQISVINYWSGQAGSDYVPSYDNEHRALTEKNAYRIKRLERDITFYSAKIANWRPLAAAKVAA